MILGSLVGRIWTPPNYMGVWMQNPNGVLAEPFFVWGYECEGEFKGRGIDVEGAFTVDGRIVSGDISFKKVYTSQGPNNKPGFTVCCIGKEEGEKFSGEYYLGEQITIATSADGRFVLEKYDSSDTLDCVVDNLSNRVERRESKR